jgi:RNA polymerase sigma factor (sigma-70 family)
MSKQLDPNQTRPSLLLRVRDVGDIEAWRTFVNIYAPVIYRFSKRHGLQDADGTDLTQDVLSEVARAMRSFEYEPDRGRFRDWLLIVTRRKLYRFRERQARRPEYDREAKELEGVADDRNDVDWNEAYSAQVLKVALERIESHFQPATWHAFKAVWIENRSAAETADLLSLRIDQVYLAKSRVLKRLSEEVREIADAFSWLDTFETS